MADFDNPNDMLAFQLATSHRVYEYLQPLFANTGLMQFDLAARFEIIDEFNLKDCAQELEDITAEVNTLIDATRSTFPRAHFLSAEDVLNLAAHSPEADPSNPLSVLPRLANFSSVRLNNERSIVAIEERGESIELLTPVPTRGVSSLRWLPDLLNSSQNQMRMNLKSAWSNCHEQLSWPWHDAPVSELAAAYPTQTALLVLRLRFTAAVDEALSTQEFGPLLEAMHQELIGQAIPTIVSAIGQAPEEPACGRIRTLLAETLSQADQVEQMLDSDTDAMAVADWTDSLRYYWEAPDQLMVRCGLSEVPFGFAYHNRQRPSVSSIASRRAASSAMRSAVGGGAVWVHGGDSAVEVLQLLAHDLGRIPLLLPCSVSTDYAAVQKYIEGMLRVDDVHLIFNHFGSMTRDAIVQKPQGVPTAVWRRSLVSYVAAEAKHGVHSFVIGTPQPQWVPEEIAPKIAQCDVPATEPVQHLLLILASLGFKEFSVLATQLIQFSEWAAVNLSPQPFYNFGLRQLKLAAFAARPACTGGDVDKTSEKQRIGAGLCSMVLPRCTVADSTLLQSYLLEHFDISDPKAAVCLVLPEVQQAALSSMRGSHYKLTQFVATARNQHAVTALCPNEAISTTLQALSCCAPLVGVNPIVLSHDDMDAGDMLGCYYGKPRVDASTGFKGKRAWRNGILTSCLQLQAQTAVPVWVLLNVRLNSELVNALSGLLSEGRQLVLQNEEVLHLPTNVTLVFLVDQISMADLGPQFGPNTGVVNFDTNDASGCCVQ